MRRTICTLRIAALLSMMAVTAARATTLLETVASTPAYGVTNIDTGPPPSLVESILDYNSEDDGNSLQAHGAADISGASAVSASASLPGGGGGPFRAYASAKITQTAENNSGTPLEYQFDFSLVGPKLLIHNGAGSVAFYNAEIKLNGVDIWYSSATLYGAYFGGYSLVQTGTDLGATFIGSGLDVGYQFGNYSNVLALGTFPDGSTVTVESLLEVWFEGPGAERYGSAEIGDPNDLSASAGFGGNLSPVPEPASLLYLVLGCSILLLPRFALRKCKA